MTLWQKPKGDPNDGFLLADGGLFGNDPTVPAILYTLFTKEYFLSETPPSKPIDNLKNIAVLSIATGMTRGKKSAQDMVSEPVNERESDSDLNRLSPAVVSQDDRLDNRAGVGWWFSGREIETGRSRESHPWIALVLYDVCAIGLMSNLLSLDLFLASLLQKPPGICSRPC